MISTLGEEAKMPRKLIPQATFLALTIFGASIIGGLWCLSYALPWDKLKAVADAGGMPISEIARQYWGGWAVLVPITAISAALGISIATAVGASRVLFSMGRGGLAPAVLGELHPRHQVPWKAMHVIFGLGFVAAAGTGALLGPYNAPRLVGNGGDVFRDAGLISWSTWPNLVLFRSERAGFFVGHRFSAARFGAGRGDRKWTV